MIYPSLNPYTPPHLSFIDGITVRLNSPLGHDVRLYRDTEHVASVSNVRSAVHFPYRWRDDWRVEVYRNNVRVWQGKGDLREKNVLIDFHSSALGDTLAWLPAVHAFQEQTGARVHVHTHHNKLFTDAYPHLTFIEGGVVVHHLAARYRLGWFYEAMDHGQYHRDYHPNDFKGEPLQWTAARILGIPPKEERPRISTNLTHIDGERLEVNQAHPYVCIGPFSTCGAKEWQNPRGWAEVIAHHKARGYKVYVLGNKPERLAPFLEMGALPTITNALEDVPGILLGAMEFIGLGSGLSWLAWALEVPTTIISGFSQPYTEPRHGIRRITPPAGVCQGCFNNHRLDAADWNWCPQHQGTQRQHECTKTITAKRVTCD